MIDDVHQELLTPIEQHDFNLFINTNPESYKEYHILLDGKEFIYYKSKGFILYQKDK